MRIKGNPEQFEIVVVGAGFAGLYALYKFRSQGYRVRVLEAGSGVGGVWFWNRYPGARCDVESIDYSYSFSSELEQDWNWSERYATQPEIRAYLDHVADRFDLRADISLDTCVTAANFDEDTRLWNITTDTGSKFVATYCLMATGPLSIPAKPNIPGLETFAGPVYFTSSWPDEPVDLGGKNVGLIGTGSSGIQATPMIARLASSLTVFQRTPSYSIPAKNRPMTPSEMADVRSRYPELRTIARNSGFGNSSWASMANADVRALDLSQAERDAIYERQWEVGGPGMLTVFPDLMTNLAVNKTAGEFVRRKIAETVQNPDTAHKLTPDEDLAIGCKRICVDIDYYETFNRDNVALADLRSDPLEAVEAAGIRTRSGFYPLDVLVLATGFDAMTGALARIDIQGDGGQRLKEKWADGPINYLGIAIGGFPNFFVLNGPGSPSVTANLVLTSEVQVDWLADLFQHAEKQSASEIRANAGSERAWAKLVGDIAAQTIFTAGCNSWFVGANIPGKPRLFTAFAGGLNAYAGVLREQAADGYSNFEFGSPSGGASSNREATESEQGR